MQHNYCHHVSHHFTLNHPFFIQILTCTFFLSFYYYIVAYCICSTTRLPAFKYQLCHSFHNHRTSCAGIMSFALATLAIYMYFVLYSLYIWIGFQWRLADYNEFSASLDCSLYSGTVGILMPLIWSSGMKLVH